MIQFDQLIFFKWVGEKPPTSDSLLLMDACPGRVVSSKITLFTLLYSLQIHITYCLFMPCFLYNNINY